MDYKQQRLISGWIKQAERSEEPYFSFMALWIASSTSGTEGEVADSVQ